jgi:serine/threonine protein kinase
MALAAGNRLGPYEIVSAIGAGGIGEVYRARDTKLGRGVAIKVLPASVTSDPDRLAVLNRTWALDFMTETLYDGRGVRLLMLIDEGNREGCAGGRAAPHKGPSAHHRKGA